MPSFGTVGNIIVYGVECLDLADALLTGITSPAGVTLTLQRQSGSTMIPAAEVVSWTEIGVTGRYYFSFTPLNSGRYILYTHLISALSNGAFREYTFEITTAGATFSATYANAFCAETDIERWIQTAIDATTKPNDSETAAFAESRAAILMALCAAWGYTVTSATVTAGSRLEDLLREANAIGAALDYTVAQQFRVAPNTSERAQTLQTLWDQYIKPKDGYLYVEVNANLSASLATDHILSGDTLAYNEGAAPTNAPIGIGMGSLF